MSLAPISKRMIIGGLVAMGIIATAGMIFKLVEPVNAMSVITPIVTGFFALLNLGDGK